jgi:hypothetical protein
MFEARLDSAEQFRQIIDAMKDLVQDANLDCSPSGITLQVRGAAPKLTATRPTHVPLQRASSPPS